MNRNLSQSGVVPWPVWLVGRHIFLQPLVAGSIPIRVCAIPLQERMGDRQQMLLSLSLSPLSLSLSPSLSPSLSLSLSPSLSKKQ